MSCMAPTCHGRVRAGPNRINSTAARLSAEWRRLGYSRTGPIIEEGVSDAISRLLASGTLGREVLG
jgi:hypothetical protein